MNKKYIIDCHDCAKSLLLLDKFEELTPEEIQYCPICGNQNIEIQEKERN